MFVKIIVILEEEIVFEEFLEEGIEEFLCGCVVVFEELEYFFVLVYKIPLLIVVRTVGDKDGKEEFEG